VSGGGRYALRLESILHQIGSFDRVAIEASQAVRWGPLTAFFVVVSAWWVKWPLFVAVGVLWDAHGRRWPRAALCGAAAAGIAAGLGSLGKQLADRARPPVAHSSVDPLVAIPESSSFPSGHAATAFAAAVAVSAFHPRLRWPLLALAALVAVSRVYLGVHYWLDVAAGAALGAGVGLLVASVVRRATAGRDASAGVQASPGRAGAQRAPVARARSSSGSATESPRQATWRSGRISA
jgi:undecaprenyl-diphosphatase